MSLFLSECGNCGSKEHATGDCPHGLLSSECAHCGSKNHATHNCPHGLLSSKCASCGSTDHSTDQCPHGLLSSKCGHCGSRNHSTNECPHGLLSSKCGNCGSTDHSTGECPNAFYGSRDSSSSHSNVSDDASSSSRTVPESFNERYYWHLFGIGAVLGFIAGLHWGFTVGGCFFSAALAGMLAPNWWGIPAILIIMLMNW
jgi:hypothetical protein